MDQDNQRGTGQSIEKLITDENEYQTKEYNFYLAVNNSMYDYRSPG